MALGKNTFTSNQKGPKTCKQKGRRAKNEQKKGQKMDIKSCLQHKTTYRTEIRSMKYKRKMSG